MAIHFLTTIGKAEKLLLLILLVVLISSCQSRYEIKDIDVTRESWDTLSVNAQCREIKWYGSKQGVPKVPRSQKFTIQRSNGVVLGQYSSGETAVINDRTLDDSELLTIIVTAEFPKGIIKTKETTINASPKSVTWKTDVKITPGLRSFHVNASASFVRKGFRGGEDSPIESVTADKILTIRSDSLAVSQKLRYSGDEDFDPFSDEFYEGLKSKYYRLHSLPIEFVHEVTWKGVKHTNTQTLLLDLKPDFSVAWNNYRYTNAIESNGAFFYKLYIQKGTIGVFTLRNSGGSGDLDLYAYSGDHLSAQPAIGRSFKGALSNEILYFPGNDDYVYVKVHNSTDVATECTLTAHAVNLEDVASKVLADYFLEQMGHALVQGILKQLFGVEDDDKVGDEVTNIGADVLLNVFKGATLESATEDVLKAELEKALLTGEKGAEAKAILSKFINALVENIYMYY